METIWLICKMWHIRPSEFIGDLDPMEAIIIDLKYTQFGIALMGDKDASG